MDFTLNSLPNPDTTIARTLAALKEARTRIEMLEKSHHDLIKAQNQIKTEPIAIIGMACRFPGRANSPDQFWDLMDKGQDAISEFPDGRWDVDAYYDANPDSVGKIYTRKGGFLTQVDTFDAQFFGISPREAMSLDPQHRLLLEVSWEALEDACQSPDQLLGSRTGVFVGIGQNDYEQYRLFGPDPSKIDSYDATGSGFCFASGRLSYFYDFHGPSMSIDTACSSSLVALHQACKSLLAGECDLALAGGVQIMLKPESGIYLSRIKVLSPDGRCKTFDASADGYGRGEGCGVIALRRLSEASARGDQILAVIRGSAVNHDGSSSSFTAPNGQAQQALLRQAFQNADIDAASVDYVEAHGTGTPLGDPIEVNALAAVLGPGRSADRPLWIGSVKTNINHLEAASGIAGIIKVVLALQHDRIPAHLLFNTPSPHIPWDRLPVQILASAVPWPVSSHHPRRAGVSAFGISGTNAHIIIEEAPGVENKTMVGVQTPSPTDSRGDRPVAHICHVLTLSARTPQALTDLVQLYHDHLTQHSDLSLSDICFSAASGRTHFSHRIAAVADSTQALRNMLTAQSLQKADDVDKKIQSHQPSKSIGFYQGKMQTPKPDLVFLFTGQGSQYPGMGKQLYDHQPEFRKYLNQCRDCSPLAGISLTDLLFSSQDGFSIHDTAFTQPALFALEYSLARMWQSWGIEPVAVMGHSVGEYVAACLAGVFSLEDALGLIAARGHLIQALPKTGAMLAVLAERNQVSAAIASVDALVANALVANTRASATRAFDDRLEIAALNGPRNVVVSGHQDQIRLLAQQLKLKGISAIPLQVSHAFHSAQMEPMLQDFLQAARKVKFHAPKMMVISNVSGQPADQTIASAEYWAKHIRQPVRFADSMDYLYNQGFRWFLEVGPQPVLIGMGKQCITDPSCVWLSSLRQAAPDWQTLLNALAQLYVSGFPVNWEGVYKGCPHRLLSLPTYPFQRRRFWIDPIDIPAGTGSHISNVVGTRLPPGEGRPGAPPMLHPLIDEKIASPALNAVLFQKHFSPDSLVYLADHRIFDSIVVPGAFHISMAVSAAGLMRSGSMRSGQEIVLENLMFPQALALSDHESCMLQIVLTPEENDRFGFCLGKISDNGESWQEHAAGKIAFLPKAHHPSRTVDIEMLKKRCPEKIDGSVYYQRLANSQIHLGPQFRWIKTIWRGQDEAIGLMIAPKIDGLAQYEIHPTLIDACFQLLVALLPDQDTRTMVPSSVDSFHFICSPHGGAHTDRLWCYVRPQSMTESSNMIASIQLLNDLGDTVATVDRFLGLAANPANLLRGLKSRDVNWRYFPVWQPEPVGVGSPARIYFGLLAAHTMDSPEYLLAARTGACLIFADKAGLGQDLAKYLITQGVHSQLVYAHEMIHPTDLLNDTGAMEMLPFLNILAKQPSDLRTVIYLWHLDPIDPDRSEKSFATISTLDPRYSPLLSALSLIQALLHTLSFPLNLSPLPKMWIVTRGAQAAGLAPISPWQAPVWGLSRVLRMEFPDLACRCVDLDPLDSTHDFSVLCHEVTDPDHEDQVAWRNRQRFVFRLMRQVPFSELGIRNYESGIKNNPQFGRDIKKEGPGYLKRAELEDSNYDSRLKITALGQLENLFMARVERRIPGPEEVEITVKAAGLNFKDVLHALGMLQAMNPEGKPVSAPEMDFGLEAVGTISALGSRVTGFTIGEVVIAGVTRGALGSRVIAPVAFICPKPVHISDAAAATLPIVFLTAWHGLINLAKIGPQDRVLIHAAAGGVGQAAIQLALRIGAEIFATASPSKWNLLKSQGITHIFNSRTLDFGDEILKVTGGKGVTVILNSLGDEFIAKNLEVLASTGRFIEIGKIGIWNTEKMHQIRPDVSYHSFELGELSCQKPEWISLMMQNLHDLLQEGQLQPISHQVFPMSEAVDAFRLMAQGKHVGKVVLVQPEPSESTMVQPESLESTMVDPQNLREEELKRRKTEKPVFSKIGKKTFPASDIPIIRPDATYLITGGLGSLGRITAQCLIQSGARHLILVGRNAPGDEANHWLTARLKHGQKDDVKIMVLSANIANPVDAAKVLTPKPDWPPLRGIVHAAGVLDDGVITQQSHERFLCVMEPKVSGTWQLHTLSQELPLDFFICFSSIASLLGSPGQANYAAANAFMDALMHHRRQHGLPGLSINWGPWGQVGMAAGLETRDHVRWQDQGLRALAPESALNHFTDMLREQLWPQVGVVDVNWDRYIEQVAATTPPFLTELMRRNPQPFLPASSRLRNDLQSLPDTERLMALSEAIRRQVARILGASVDEIGMDQGFFELGMDSLTSVELRNFLQSALGCPVPLTLTFDYPTTERLAEHLIQQVFKDRNPDPQATQNASEHAVQKQVAESHLHEGSSQSHCKGSSQLPDTANLSDTELEKLLDARLSDLENRL